MRRLFAPFVRLFLVVAITFAMAGTSFAHRIAPLDVDESLLAYIAAGGTLDDLCGEAGLGAGGRNTCDACRLVNGVVIPTVDVSLRSEIEANLLQSGLRVLSGPIAQVINPACPVRAPPVV